MSHRDRAIWATDHGGDPVELGHDFRHALRQRRMVDVASDTRQVDWQSRIVIQYTRVVVAIVIPHQMETGTRAYVNEGRKLCLGKSKNLRKAGMREE